MVMLVFLIVIPTLMEIDPILGRQMVTIIIEIVVLELQMEMTWPNFTGDFENVSESECHCRNVGTK